MDDPWSIESFCDIQRQKAVVDFSIYPENTRVFLTKLGLPSFHPFCEKDSNVTDQWLIDAGVPPMGPAEIDFLDLHDGSLWNALVTRWYMVVPTFLAFWCLWLLLFAAIIAPVGLLYLMSYGGDISGSNLKTTCKLSNPQKNSTVSPTRLFLACTMTVTSSLAMMTDAMYLHDFESGYGTTLFLLSSFLAFRTCLRYKLRRTFMTTLILWVVALALQLTTSEVPSTLVDEGLYHDGRNPLVDRIASLWKPTHRIYSTETGATRWQTTGDVRTGLPFFLNTFDEGPEWVRVWLPTSTDEEVLALDISFPRTGHDDSKPVYLLFHGLSGGSSEGYVFDLTTRRNAQRSTVVVMVARGMMDLPVRSWSFFHGARTSDAHDAATTIRKALNSDQLLVGVGYSMGSIVLNNYVATSGKSCGLDAAFSISGALDCRFQLDAARSKTLWQPLLQDGLKRRFLLAKHGKKVLERLSKWEFIQLLRASSVVDVDRWMSVGYHGYESVEKFYASMSALGDIPSLVGEYNKNNTLVFAGRKISNVSIPLCVLHALDDPISTWRTISAPHGPMRPDQLVQAGNGNLMLLLTKAGGHVGWPLGLFSPRRKWEFMSESAADFVDALQIAKDEEKNQQCSLD